MGLFDAPGEESEAEKDERRRRARERSGRNSLFEASDKADDDELAEHDDRPWWRR